jgi:FkbM family methyltransferase
MPKKGGLRFVKRPVESVDKRPVEGGVRTSPASPPRILPALLALASAPLTLLRWLWAALQGVLLRAASAVHSVSLFHARGLFWLLLLLAVVAVVAFLVGPDGGDGAGGSIVASADHGGALRAHMPEAPPPPPPPSPRPRAPDSGMCSRFPFTTTGAPADDRAGCAYGPKEFFVKAYLAAPGNSYSNSDDVTYAFTADVRSWSLSGATGLSAAMNKRGAAAVVFDVGANVGSYSQSLVELYSVSGAVNTFLHAFEPYPPTYKQVAAKFKGNPHVLVHPVAVTDEATVKKHNGVAEFFGAYLDINPAPTGASIGRTEDVQVSVGMVNMTTFDDFIDALEADSSPAGLKGREYVVPMFKIDTEGQDLAVLRGAESFLTRKHPAALFFEWGAKWVRADPSYTLVEALKITDRHG